MRSSVEKHFDEIAGQYDYFKKRNWYYYENLKALYRQLIPAGSVVLEVGCGTGDLISHIGPATGVGIDISREMIRIAREKHHQIHFEAATLEQFHSDIKFQYIFFADVLEHLEDVGSTINALKKFSRKGAKIIFSYINPIWEPVVLLLERLSMKMPEGPHYRIPYRKFKGILHSAGFAVLERDWRLIVPTYIPLLSGAANKLFYRIPLAKRFGWIEYLVIEGDSDIERF